MKNDINTVPGLAVSLADGWEVVGSYVSSGLAAELRRLEYGEPVHRFGVLWVRLDGKDGDLFLVHQGYGRMEEKK